MGVDLNSLNETVSNPLSVLIIGCGNIAGGFDEKVHQEKLPYTHAGAYIADGRFKITACVEPDDTRRSEFMDAWKVTAGFKSTDEVLSSKGHFDVISICSPTAFHANDVEKAILLKPKLIFCEKPLTTLSALSAELIEACKKADIQLAVNYTRRWDPDILKLKAGMRDGEWGELRSVVGYYNKGILNNGSHMLDLLHFLVGTLTIVKVGKPILDYSSSDPTVPVWVEGLGDIPIYLACGHTADYSIFELQFVFSKGVLIMEEGGLFWRERSVIDSSTFKNYRVLNDGVRRAGNYTYAMLRAIDNIYGAINSAEKLASTGESALVAQQLCEQIAQQACKLDKCVEMK